MEYHKPTPFFFGVFTTIFFVFVLFFYFFTLSAPAGFKEKSTFTVTEGETLSEIASSLKNEGYIRSSTVFKIVVKGFLDKETGAVAGDYFFDQNLPVFSVARRIVTGDSRIDAVRVTIPEGLNKFEVATLLRAALPKLDTKKFISLAKEGYLFPDTYFFPQAVTAEVVAETMTENFDVHLKSYTADITNSGRTLSDLIKMASIVETEARQTETRRIVAGILWKRIEIGMPLQVDVSFKYINGKSTTELTEDDLKLDSPYNSYKYAGLPPTPISNPGIDSIEATLFPQETPYLYFLTDNEGVMRYAATFEEHKKNKLLYLR